MKNMNGVICTSAVAAMAVLIGLTGCEKEENAVVITIFPNPIEITVSNDTVLLTATGGLRALSLPMEWSVSSPLLGTIDTAYRGDSAVYVSRDVEGVNLVTVRDQYGAEGHATITHVYSSPTGITDQVGVGLVASQGEIPVGQNTTTITATNGVAPFAWRVGDSSYGNVGASGNPVVYTSSRAGANTVYVTDRDGRQGQITIVQL